MKITINSEDLAKLSEKAKMFYILESAYKEIVRMAGSGELEMSDHQPIYKRQLVKNEQYDISSYLVLSPDGRLKEEVINGDLNGADFEGWKDYELKLNLGERGTEETAKQMKILELFTEILGRKKIEELTPEVVLKATKKGFLQSGSLKVEKGYIETDE